MPLASPARSATAASSAASRLQDSGSDQTYHVPSSARLAHWNPNYYFPGFPDSSLAGPTYRPASSSTAASTTDSASTALTVPSVPSSTAPVSPMASQDSDAVKHEAAHYAASSSSGSRLDSADATLTNAASAPAYTQPRKRASRAGTRSVTTLSAAQLERKRANDREAQRAIRARTKEHIDKLERHLAELQANGNQNEQLLASMKRIRELEEDNAMLRGKLQQAHYSLGIPPEAQDSGWTSTSSMIRTPIPHVGMTVMSQSLPQMQASVPSTTRHEPAAQSFGSWQDPSNTFGSPASMRRTGGAPFQHDISSLGGAPRRDNISPVGVAPVGSSSSTASSEYTYRPGLAPQYGAIPESASQHIARDPGMGSMHMGQPGMATYGAPAQQHHGPPSVLQQPRFVPYSAAAPAGQHQAGPNGTASFTAQNPPPQQQQQQQHQQQQQQQQQSQQQPQQPQQNMYYAHATYGH